MSPKSAGARKTPKGGSGRKAGKSGKVGKPRPSPGTARPAARLRVRLIHWKPAEAEAVERMRLLRDAGYRVELEPFAPSVLAAMRARPPAAVLIDLGRLPSQGRDVAVALRTTSPTRRVPILFVGGDPAKVAGIRDLLPDAVYTTWGRVAGALRRAMAKAPRDPVVPASALAGYSGTPLPRKLGIKAGRVVALVGAPASFEATLGDLPPEVVLRRGARGRCDLVIWFPASRKELETRVERMGRLAGGDGLWIAWPKKASGVQTDLDQAAVRGAGLAVGLVDYKIAALDAVFSGLKFARRKPGAGKESA